MPRLRALATGLLALVAPLLVTPPGQAATGSITAVDGVLFEGCHTYPYSYDVRPASPQWHLETFLYGPDGQKLAAGLFIAGGDPTSGSSAFGICRRATEPGSFRIEAQLTTTSGNAQDTEHLPPMTFLLALPGSASALAVNDVRPRRGDSLVFTLTSMRQAPESMVPNELATVALQRRTPAGWRRVGGGLTETNAQGLARIRLSWPGGHERFRMVTRADAGEYAGSRSAALTVRTR